MGPVAAIIGVVAAGVLGVSVYFALRFGHRAHLIRATPLAQVKELTAGVAKVRGQAVSLTEKLESPLQGKPCIYFRFKVEEKRQHAGPHGGRSYWKTVIDDKQHIPCGVDDGTGIAAVNLAHAEFVIATDGQQSSGWFNDAPPELERVLQQRYGRSSKGWIFNKSMRYSESVVEEGDPLFIVGIAEQTPGGHWQFVKGSEPLIVSDRSEDKLHWHYRSSSVLCWVLAAVVTTVGGIVVGMMLVG